MPQFVESRRSKLRVLLSMAFAAIFGLAFYVVGFGFFLSIVSAALGFRSAWSFLSRSGEGGDTASQMLLENILRGERIPSGSRFDFSSSTSESTPFGTFLSGLKKILIRGPVLQQAASRILIMQLAIGAVTIPLFWLIQKIGFQVNLFNNPSLVRLFAENINFDGSSVAKARFENLFVPLMLIYVLSLPVLASAFLCSLGATVLNLRKHWPVLVGVPLFIIAPVMLLFQESFVAHNWQRLIGAGEVWGYLLMFVMFPLCLLFLTASLPNQRSR
jgi:hypothetical protein